MKAQKEIRIVIQPLGDLPEIRGMDVYDDLVAVYSFVEMKKAIKIPAVYYYKPNRRYRADIIIKWLGGKAKDGEIYLGITNRDISITKGKYEDYGIMGLGFMPGKGCVISDFRLRDKNKLPVLALHELGHAFGLPHCTQKQCYMRDAEGKDHTGQLNQFCIKCKGHLKERGWLL